MFKKELGVFGRVLAICSLAFAIISANSVCVFSRFIIILKSKFIQRIFY